MYVSYQQYKVLARFELAIFGLRDRRLAAWPKNRVSTSSDFNEESTLLCFSVPNMVNVAVEFCIVKNTNIKVKIFFAKNMNLTSSCRIYRSKAACTTVTYP